VDLVGSLPHYSGNGASMSRDDKNVFLELNKQQQIMREALDKTYNILFEYLHEPSHGSETEALGQVVRYVEGAEVEALQRIIGLAGNALKAAALKSNETKGQ